MLTNSTTAGTVQTGGARRHARKAQSVGRPMGYIVEDG